MKCEHIFQSCCDSKSTYIDNKSLKHVPYSRVGDDIAAKWILMNDNPGDD